MPYWLCFRLESEATFGAGQGRSGQLDLEVTHDQYGLLYLAGRSLKGLLVEACANIFYALSRQGGLSERWHSAALELYGVSGSTRSRGSLLAVGDAQMPDDLRTAVRHAVDGEAASLTPDDVLESFTSVRTQTAVDTSSGAADAGSLRSMRVILGETPFEARLSFAERPSDLALSLLAACVLGMRRPEVACNRGRGRLAAELHGDDDGHPARESCTGLWFRRFCQEVRACTR